MNELHRLICDECGAGPFPSGRSLNNHQVSEHQGYLRSGFLTDAEALLIRERMPHGPPYPDFCNVVGGELGINWMSVFNISAGLSYKRPKACPEGHPLRLVLNERNAAKQRIRDKVKPAMRKEIGERQDWKCVYCGRDISKRSSIDHIVPVEHGGQSNIENLQMTCLRCNQSKGASSDVEYRVKLANIQKALQRRDERAQAFGWSSYDAERRFLDCPCHPYGCAPGCTGCEMCEHDQHSPPPRVVCPVQGAGIEPCPTSRDCGAVRQCLLANARATS